MEASIDEDNASMDSGSDRKRKLDENEDSDDSVDTMASMMAERLTACETTSPADLRRMKAMCAEKINGDSLETRQKEQQKFEDDNNLWVNSNEVSFLRYCTKRLSAQIRKAEAQIYKNSLKRLVDLSNMDREAAEKEIDLKIHLAPGASDSSHKNSNRQPVNIEQGNFALTKLPELSSAGEIPSEILTTFDTMRDNEQRRFYNEHEVGDYINRTLKDAAIYVKRILEARCTGNSTVELVVRMECSMFSNKPDHFVLYVKNNKSYYPVLTVEDKKEHSTVFNTQRVLSQVNDYIMLNKMLHGHPSVAILSTFNQSKVCQDPVCDEDLMKDSDRFSNESLEKIAKMLVIPPETQNDQTSVGEIAPPPADVEEGFVTPPATQPKQPLTDSPPELLQDEEHDTRTDGQSDNRTPFVVYSEETYGPTQLFSVLCNAMLVSMKIGLQRIKMYCGGLKSGQTVLVLRSKGKLEEDGQGSREKIHEWRHQDTDIGLSGPWTKFTDEKREYVVTSLVGVGSTSRCWGAVIVDDNTCYSCVVKYWIKIWDPEANEYLQKNAIEKESGDSSQREVDNYNNVYSDLFFTENQVCVGRQVINGVWCVVLPFFEPVKKEERTIKTLIEIMEVLRRQFYRKDLKRSYQFKESDRRWKHAGYYRQNLKSEQRQTVLFDLADLDIIENATLENHEAYVKKHIEELFKRGIEGVEGTHLPEGFFEQTEG